jgi:hypothetical protein
MEVMLLPESRRSSRSLVDGNTLACRWAVRFSRPMSFRKAPRGNAPATTLGGSNAHHGGGGVGGWLLRTAKKSCAQHFQVVGAAALVVARTADGLDLKWARVEAVIVCFCGGAAVNASLCGGMRQESTAHSQHNPAPAITDDPSGRSALLATGLGSGGFGRLHAALRSSRYLARMWASAFSFPFVIFCSSI